MLEKWKVVRLEEIACIERGRFSPRPRNDPKYFGGDIPFLQTGDVSNAKGFIRGYAQTLNMQGLRVSKMFPAGTLLMTIAANVGDVAEAEFEFACTDSIVAIIPKDFIDRRWLRYCLNSLKFYLESLAPQNAQANLNLKLLRPIELNLPPFPEQKVIADTLSTWDAAIEKMERLITAKETLLNGLGHRFFIRGNAGVISKWNLTPLCEVLKEHGDLSTGAETVYSVSVHKGLVDQVEHLGRSYAAADTSNYNRVHFGDIVYTKSPTGDFPLGIIKQSSVEQDVIVSPLYGVFTPAAFELGVILDFLFSSPVSTKNYLNPLVQKGAKNTISITNSGFLRGKLWLPMDSSEQKKLCDLIQTARSEIRALQALLEKLHSQKRGLMQKLLTGLWRINTHGDRK